MDSNRIRKAYEDLVETRVADLKAKLEAIKSQGLGALCKTSARRMDKYMQLLETADPAYVLGEEGIKLLLLKKEQRMVAFLAAYEEVDDTGLSPHMAAWELELEFEVSIVKGDF